MSSDNSLERLWRVQATINKLILDHKRDPDKVANILQQIIDERQSDTCFQLVTSFGIVVPADYDYSTRLDMFRAEHQKEFCYYNPAITDTNFNHPSLKLSPGLKFRVKVFQITKTVTSEDCLAFLKSQPRNVFLGAQGASLVYEQRRNELPRGRCHVSFDEKENLWQGSDGYLRVPYVFAYSGGDFGFNLGCFEDSWHAGHCLLCFCDNN